MDKRILNTEQLKAFSQYLCREKKSVATQEKYLRDVRAFCVYANGEMATKELVLVWKNT